MSNSCSSMHIKSQSCIVLFGLLLQQLYGILGQPSYMLYFCNIRKHVANVSLHYTYVYTLKTESLFAGMRILDGWIKVDGCVYR